jgi:pimeloyl-ACP methyl ester carboxylesterase
MKTTTHVPDSRGLPGRVARASLVACILTAISVPAGAVFGDDVEPAPETVALEANDGAVLSCRWYPSPKSESDGKNVIPIIILHGWAGQGSQLDGLATYLRARGHAVIVPDLRGHGASMTLKRPNENPDMEMKIADDGDFEADGQPVAGSVVMDFMVRYDMETVKGFLTDKNDLGEVNMELLCLVAFDEMSIVAVNWAAHDWSRQQPADRKQGQDVKALVLISPVRAFRGATMAKALTHETIRDRLSVMIVAGKQDASAYRDATRLHTSLERKRAPLPRDDADRLKLQDLFLIGLNTSLQGVRILNQPSFDIEKKIAAFIQLRLVNQRSHRALAWRQRRQNTE